MVQPGKPPSATSAGPEKKLFDFGKKICWTPLFFAILNVMRSPPSPCWAGW